MSTFKKQYVLALQTLDPKGDRSWKGRTAREKKRAKLKEQTERKLQDVSASVRERRHYVAVPSRELVLDAGAQREGDRLGDEVEYRGPGEKGHFDGHVGTASVVF